MIIDIAFRIPEGYFFVRNNFCWLIGMPSSVVNSYIYFPETEVLRIIYQSGAVYDYLKVPFSISEKFREARSKGRFLNSVIKRKFKYIKVS